MKKKLIAIITLLIIISVAALCVGCQSKQDDGSLMRIGCMSDLHSKDMYFNAMTAELKPNVKDTLTQMGNKRYDVMVIGGDITSSASPAKHHTYGLYDKLLAYTDKITPNVLYVSGNHDYSAGLNKYPSSKVTTTDGYYYDYNAADFYGYMMKERIGELKDGDAYYEYYDNGGNKEGAGDYLLGYHYAIKGVDFVALNPHPDDLLGIRQRTNYTYTKGSIDWLTSTLEKIGKDKTVFLIAHIPLASSVNLRTNKGINDEEISEYMQSKLTAFPNLIWLYGHDHSNGTMLDSEGNKVAIDCYIRDDTSQRITQYYDSEGNKSFITCFVGSMSYLYGNMNDDLNPKIYQGLDVSIFEDKIVFQMINYGEKSSESGDIKPFVVERKVNVTA